SDLRLKTIPCYTPPDTSTAPCPLGQIDAGVRAQVMLDNLVLHTEPGDDAPTSGQVTNGATITVIQQGKVAASAAASSGSTAGTGSSGGIDLGGAALPGQSSGSSGNSSGAASKPTDDRNWWQIKTDSGQQGWVPETISDKPALTRQPVLYSLDYGFQNFRD